MKARVHCLMIVALLSAPLRAVAGGAITQARAVSNDSASFDGGHARSEGGLVRAGATSDARTPGQLAKDEQLLADARDAQANRSIGNLTSGADVEGPKKIKTEWLSIPLVQTAVVGGLAGLVIGSLFGPIGLIVGPLLGAALSYGLSVHAANKAKAAGE
ncbi:MAG: hypothetical protein ABL955_07005 [Elusimicrobiota bacterium]